MSNGTPPDATLTQRLERLRTAGRTIEQLAAGYYAALRPVREALQAVADTPLEERDRWAVEVSALARQLAESGMADVPASLQGVERWGRQFDAGHPGRAFAGQLFCAALAGAIADGSSPAGFFDALGQHPFVTTPAAVQEICAVLSRLLYVHTEQTAPRFTRDYGAVLREAGIDGETLRIRLTQCGAALSAEAVAAVREWDECSTGVPFYDVDIRPATDRADANNGAEESEGGPPESRTECPAQCVEEPRSEAAQFARFLELHALATSSEEHQVPLSTLDEYQHLLVRFGVYTVDGISVGPPDPTQVPRMEPILNTDCIPIPGTTPHVCPRSAPRLPVEMLPSIDQRFRSLRLVGPDQSVLWVGRQARLETLCMYRNGCTCFVEGTPPPPAGVNEGEGANPESVDTPPGWADLGDAKRAVLTVLNRWSEPLQGRAVAKEAGYKYGSLRHHFPVLQTWKYIDKSKDGYVITQAGTALVPCERM